MHAHAIGKFFALLLGWCLRVAIIRLNLHIGPRFGTNHLLTFQLHIAVMVGQRRCYAVELHHMGSVTK